MVWLKGLERIPGVNEEDRRIGWNLMLMGGRIRSGEIKCIKV